MEHRNRQAGFTLIEVMIVVAVIGLLAAIAYPSYQNHVLKAQRSDAHEALLRIQMEQGRHRLNNPQYAEGLTELGYSSDVIDSTDGHYRVHIESASGSRFTVVATPQDRQTRDACTSISLQSSGGSATRNGAPSGSMCW
ncbi:MULTISPECIES: type IV pilin protein [unclassified Thioalkalivibrio]|uniref:type IV pilin protein n=1 Tax=unclassified Thioalkalivibrio TaxID=2621013 RepID=UPI000369FA02|nr:MULTISPECIES: type IV pilin protein [unclassified Thioalkalivibrio]